MVSSLDSKKTFYDNDLLDTSNLKRTDAADPDIWIFQYEVDNIVSPSDKVRKWFKKLKNDTKKKLQQVNPEVSEKELDELAALFSALYDFMKFKFTGVFRATWERYFEHLRAVVENVLEFPNPNKEKVLIAILHDSIEDIEEINYEFIEKFCKSKNIDWNTIALPVQAISKGDWKDYLSTDEKDEPEKYKKAAKKRRNTGYFSHMISFDTMKEYISMLAGRKWLTLSDDEIIAITQNAIDVKLADRIHNLSTQWDPNNIETVERKMKETEDYFLEIAKETNPDAYQKIMVEIVKLKALIEESKKTA